jgi:glycine/D-amino acid oxidase-like deaminating enzyme
MLSIWERNAFIQYDHIIIGSGIVGLTTAYYLKEKFPAQSVLILERGLLPTGASTRNAGFACMGSPSELLDDLSHRSEKEVVDLFRLRKNGLTRLSSILGHAAMGYKAEGSHELFFEEDTTVINQLPYLNQLLRSEVESDAFILRNEKIDTFGLNKSLVKAMVENRCEGQIDTGLMIKNLILLVMSMGVEIKTGCRVQSFLDTGNGAEVVCLHPFAADEIVFKSKTLSICTNGFATQLLPAMDVVPGRGQVLITKPIAGLKLKGIFHFHEGYYYCREYKGCVLIGGGRNTDFEKETTMELALNESIQQNLVDQLRSFILPNQEFEIDMQWSGIMAFGQSKQPIIQQHSEHIFIGVRMGGMGIAIGSEVGFQLANLIDIAH